MLKKILNSNIIISNIQATFELLTKSKKIQLTKVFFLSFINSWLDLLGITLIIPLLLIVLEPQENTSFISQLFISFDVTSKIGQLLFLSSIILVIFLVKNIISLYVNYTQAKFSFEVYKHWAEKLMRLYVKRGFEYLSTKNSNELVNYIRIYPINYIKLVFLPILSLVNEVFVLTIIFIGLFIYQGPLFMTILLIIGPTFYFFLRLMKSELRKIGIEKEEINVKSNISIRNMIFGFKDMKINNTEESFFFQIKNLLKRELNLNLSHTIISSIPSKLIELVVLLAIIIVTAFGIIYEINQIEMKSIVGLLALAAYKSIPSINKIISALVFIRGNQHFMPVLKEINEIDDEFLEPISLINLTINNEIIIENLNYSYNFQHVILKDVNLTIKKGECVGIIGKSGSGKSTLINLILGFLTPSSGNIKVDHNILNKENLHLWHEKIGYVSQDTFIMEGTLTENIIFSPAIENDIEDKKLMESIEYAAISELAKSRTDADKLGLGENGGFLSGGQKQRVGIARAIYSGAEILIFDEATSALDSKAEHEICKTIAFLKSKGFTILIIAHRMSSLESCDKIYKIDKGQLSSTEIHFSPTKV